MVFAVDFGYYEQAMGVWVLRFGRDDGVLFRERKDYSCE